MTTAATRLPVRLDAITDDEALALLRAVAELRPQFPSHASERLARWQKVAERVATAIHTENATASACSRSFRMLLVFAKFNARDQWPVGEDVRLLLANALDDQSHRFNDDDHEPSWDAEQDHQQVGARSSQALEEQQTIHESIAQGASVHPPLPPPVVPVDGKGSSATTPCTTGTPSTPPVSTGAKRRRDLPLARSRFAVQDDMALLRAVGDIQPFPLHALQCWQRVADAVLSESGTHWTSDECAHRYTVLLDRCASNQWPEDVALCGLVQAAYVAREVDGNLSLSAEKKLVREWPRCRLERPADDQRLAAAAASGKRRRPRGPRQQVRSRRRRASWKSLSEPGVATAPHDGLEDAVSLSTPNETPELPTSGAAPAAMPAPALETDVRQVGMASMAAVGSDISESDDNASIPTHQDQKTDTTESSSTNTTLTKWQRKRQTQRNKTRQAKVALHEEMAILKQTVATLVSALATTQETHEELKRHVAACCLTSEETKPELQQQEPLVQREQEATNERDEMHRQFTELRAELELEKNVRLDAMAAAAKATQCLQEQLDQHVVSVLTETKQLRETQDLQTTALETCKHIGESEVESVALQLQKLKKAGDYERRKHRESLAALKVELASDQAGLALAVQKMEASVRQKTEELQASIERDRMVSLESVQQARDGLMLSWKELMQHGHRELRASINESLHTLKAAHHERLHEMDSKIARMSASCTKFQTVVHSTNGEKARLKARQVDEQLTSLTRQLQQVAERGQQNQGELLEAIALELKSRATELERSLQNVLERDQQAHQAKLQREMEELRETLATGVSSFDELLETMQADQRARLLTMDAKIDATSSLSNDLQASFARQSQRSRLTTLEQESQIHVELRELRSLVDAERLERTREYTTLLRNIQVIVAGDDNEPDA